VAWQSKLRLLRKTKNYGDFFMALQICVMTPDCIFLNKEVDEIILPTNTGQMGVLSNHAPLITALDIGVMLVRTQKDWESVALMGGFALVKQNQVTVLVNEAESKETIDPQEAEETFASAKATLEQVTGQKEKVEANFAFKRARARYQVIGA
jgi:ATP synthase F1 epsilon subunit